MLQRLRSRLRKHIGTSRRTNKQSRRAAAQHQMLPQEVRQIGPPNCFREPKERFLSPSQLRVLAAVIMVVVVVIFVVMIMVIVVVGMGGVGEGARVALGRRENWREEEGLGAKWVEFE